VKLLKNLQDPNSPLADDAANIDRFSEFFKKDRKSAVKFFKYAYFLHSPYSDNPYKGFAEEIKEQKINEAVYDGKYKPTEAERGILALYEEIILEAVPTFRAFRSARNALHRLSQYLDGVDFNERDANGKPVYDVRDVTSVLKEFPNLISAFTTLEKAVYAEEFQVTKTRGQKTINIFEEPDE
jgi:hypothetical protein